MAVTFIFTVGFFALIGWVFALPPILCVILFAISWLGIMHSMEQESHR